MLTLNKPCISIWSESALFAKADLLEYYGKNIMSGSSCIKGSLGVRDSQKLPWDFQNQCQEVWDSQLSKLFSNL